MKYTVKNNGLWGDKANPTWLDKQEWDYHLQFQKARRAGFSTLHSSGIFNQINQHQGNTVRYQPMTRETLTEAVEYIFRQR